MIVFKHIRSSTNLGDTYCSPFDHAGPWPSDSIALDLDAPTPPCDAVIYGGGKISGSLRRKMGPNDLAARERVAWGVSTVQSSRLSLRYWRSFRALTLVGTRDWGDERFQFAPCVSCLSPEFDKPAEPKHEVVAYLHKWQTPKMGLEMDHNVPVMTNEGDDFAAAIRFLASGETVVSNSYHGVYWALLLGKRVLCLPFSNKFASFRVAPGYATAQDWRAHLTAAQGSREMLPICREATYRFATMVRDRLGAGGAK